MNGELYYDGFLETHGRRVVAFRPEVGRAAGGPLQGLFLAQALYWQRIAGRGAWWWKTQAQWEEEILLSRGQQERVRKDLVKLNLLQEEKRGMPSKLYFRVDVEVLARSMLAAMGIHLSDLSPTSSTMRETRILGCAKRTDLDAEIAHPYPVHQMTSEMTPTEGAGDFSKSDALGAGEEPEEDPHPMLAAAQDLVDPVDMDPEEILRRAGGKRGRKRIKKGGLRGQKGRSEDRMDVATGPRSSDRPKPTRRRRSKKPPADAWRPEPGNMKQVVAWARERRYPEQAWRSHDLFEFFQDLVEYGLEAPRPANTGKARGQARDMLKALNGEASEVLVYLVSNWDELKRQLNINAPVPTLGIALGYVDSIRGLMAGKTSEVGGSNRDKANWDEGPVVGWGDA